MKETERQRDGDGGIEFDCMKLEEKVNGDEYVRSFNVIIKIIYMYSR